MAASSSASAPTAAVASSLLTLLAPCPSAVPANDSGSALRFSAGADAAGSGRTAAAAAGGAAGRAAGLTVLTVRAFVPGPQFAVGLTW